MPLHPAFVVLALLASAGACSSPATLPEGEGAGLVRWDRRPPEGAWLVERPQWTVGDRLVYRAGDWLSLDLRVIEVGPEGMVLEEAGGTLQTLTPDLGALRDEVPGDPEQTRVNEPADASYHFPLWPGKRWAVEFVRKAPGEKQGLPLLVEYHCDREERVTVPAGEFRTLRIWRRARLSNDPESRERVSLLWYAPEIGFFVRRLNDGVLLELEEAHRQE